MPRLVALDIPLSNEFVTAVRRAWDEGDAVFPLDPRWPKAFKERVIRAVRPTHIMSTDGRTELIDNGTEAEPGDALVIATSGSTGEPKGVVHTFDSLKSSAIACHDRIGRINAHWLACLPVSHIGGFAVVARSILLDLPISVSNGSSTSDLEQAARAGANFISLVPTMLSRIDARQFDVVLLGGARPPELRPHNVLATYGSTETGSGIAYDGIPLAGVEIKIGEHNAIYARGAMLMRAYRNASTPFDDEGWLDTGDAGQLNPDGTLSVFGRRGEMIITGGENVWPDAVEKFLGELRGITECAVFGVDDPKWGQVVAALVVGDVDVSALREQLEEQLPKYAVPKHLKVVAALPRTAGGKVSRSELAI